MKKIIIIFIILILLPKFIYASNTIEENQVLEEQESVFGIKEFIKQSEKYIPNSFKDIDMSDIFNKAIKGEIDNKSFLNKIFKQFKVGFTDILQIFLKILVIVLIHSFLKTLTEGLENDSVVQMVYYVQYILIVSTIMTSFSDIIKNVNTTIESMVGFAQTLIPILISLLIFTGNIATSSFVEPIVLFIIEFIANFIKIIILPGISIITVLAIVSQISNRIQIGKLSKYMKSSIAWILGIILTVFVGVLSLEGTLTSSVDGITAKTAKAAVSSLIPVVRKSIRGWSRQHIGVWSDIKKCGWNSWNYCNYRNMYFTYYQNFFILHNVFYSICNY